MKFANPIRYKLYPTSQDRPSRFSTIGSWPTGIKNTLSSRPDMTHCITPGNLAVLCVKLSLGNGFKTMKWNLQPNHQQGNLEVRNQGHVADDHRTDVVYASIQQSILHPATRTTHTQNRLTHSVSLIALLPLRSLRLLPWSD